MQRQKSGKRGWGSSLISPEVDPKVSKNNDEVKTSRELGLGLELLNSDNPTTSKTQTKSSKSRLKLGIQARQIKFQNDIEINLEQKGNNPESLGAINHHTDPRLFLPVNLEEETFSALIDSGSTKTYAGPRVAPLLGKFCKSRATMTVANSNTVLVDGETTMEYKIGRKSVRISIRIVKALGYSFIFGIDFLKKFEIIVNFKNCTYRLPGENQSNSRIV